tara:strand:+ start:2490 stop:3512 length:1023 start_codon:yes stop_codon:yes gene_type:complete
MSFLPLNTGTDFIVNSEAITATLWSGTVPTLATYFTSSTQEASSAGNYYLNVYQTASSYTISEVQFAIAYANKQGSGSALYNGAVGGNSFTRTLYGQYRTLVLGDENADFNFGGVTQSDFYVLSIDRARYKEKLFPGTFNLQLSGSGRTLKLTDDSKDIASVSFNDAGRVFQIVSGSNGNAYVGNGYTAASGSYGFLLPDIGTIILNAAALDLSAANGGIGLATTRSFNGDTGTNNARFFNHISGAASFSLNSEETISSNYAFIKVPNSEMNYSENPSFISSSTGEILYLNEGFNFNPRTYATTVGLYNPNNELLAVAKLSRPIPKDFTKELAIRIKLDF